MMLTATQDIFGHRVELTSDKLRHILDLIDGYVKVPYTIQEIRQDDVNDKNGRIDIEVIYEKDKQLVLQKLLILKDEVIDGITFHKRQKEWY